MPVQPAVETLGLSRRFGAVTAVSDLSLSVVTGSIFGLLGPNGAGKTTTIKMLTTMLPPSAGTARVSGFDTARQGNPIVRRITKEEAGPNPKRFTPRLPCSIDRSETGSVVCSSHGEDLIGIITRVEDESPLPGHVTSWLCPVSNEELFEDA